MNYCLATTADLTLPAKRALLSQGEDHGKKAERGRRKEEKKGGEEKERERRLQEQQREQFHCLRIQEISDFILNNYSDYLRGIVSFRICFINVFSLLTEFCNQRKGGCLHKFQRLRRPLVSYQNRVSLKKTLTGCYLNKER